MPVIVVGADTESGEAILNHLHSPGREIRAFVTDVDTGLRLKSRGFKVAIGDVSDDSHVEAASLGAFTAVLIAEAAVDDRERSFAKDSSDVLKGWAGAVDGADVRRVIWVTDDTPPQTVAESASVSTAHSDFASRVGALDEAQTI
jgi:putative NADH-flavin reductase